MKVVGQDSQPGAAGVAMVSFVTTPGNSVVFKTVYVRLNGTVGVAKFDVTCLMLFFGFGGIAAAFLRHDDLINDLLQPGLVVLATKSLVEADAFDAALAVLLDDPGDSGFRLRMIVGMFHILVVEDEMMLVGGDEELATKFNRATCLPFVDPLGVGFKEREDFFRVRNGFSFQDASVNEVDVLVHHLDKVVDLEELGDLEGIEGEASKFLKGGFGFRAEDACLAKVDARTMLLTFLLVRASLFGGLAQRAHQAFEFGGNRFAFAPTGEFVFFGNGSDEFNCFATRVPQEIDVGRKMNVRFDYVAITFRDDKFFFFFDSILRPCCATILFMSSRSSAVMWRTLLLMVL